MPRLYVSLFGATLCLALAAMFVAAQPAPKSKAPPSAPATLPDAKAASPVSAPAPTMCPCMGADAQRPLAPDSHQAGMMHGGMMHGGMMQEGAAMQHAHLHEIATLASVKVQTTKAGASIQLVAKKAADTAKVQELAKELAAHLSEPAPHSHALQGATTPAQPITK